MWSDCLVYWSETNNRDVICNRLLSVSGSCLHIHGGSFSSSLVHSSNFTLMLDPVDITSRPSVCLNVTEQQSKCLETLKQMQWPPGSGTTGSKRGCPASRHQMTGLAWRLMCLVSPLQRMPCPAFSSERTWLCFCFHFSGWKLNQAWHRRRCWKIQQCANPQPTDASGHHRFAVITLHYVRLTARRHPSGWANGELD